MRAKNTFTIHTELIDGTLSGARNIYMGANSTCHLYVIPREDINIANNIEDIAGQPAFYILLGDANALNPEAYIGQTTDFANRNRVNDMEVFFRDIQLLTRFYGCSIFDTPVAKPQPEHLFYVHATDRPAEGVGFYDENAKQFVLVKGSVIANETSTFFVI